MLKRIFGIDSSFTNIMGKFADIVMVSILWLIGSLPIITVVTSTSALYYSLVKGIRKDRGTPTKEFLLFYKGNVKKGICVSGYYLLFGILSIINFWAVFQMDKATILFLVYRIIALWIVIAFIFLSIFLFPVFSRFEYQSWECMKVSLFIAFRHPISTIIMFISMGITGLVSIQYPVLLFVVPAFVFLLCSFRIEKILKKYMQEPKKGEIIPWYWDGDKRFVQDDEEK